MTRRRALRVIVLAGALLLMAVLLARLGPRRIAEQLASVGAGALWLLLAYALGTAIGALPWYLLLPRGARPTLRAAIASRFAASGANAIVPLFGLGGEPARLLWLGPAHRAAGVAAIVIDRVTYAVASALFLAAGAGAAIHVSGLPRAHAITAAAGAAALLALAALAIWLLARHRLGDRIHRLVRRLRRRAAPEGTSFGAEVDHQLDEILRRRGRVVIAVGLGVLARVAFGAEIYAGFRVLGVSLSPATALVFAAVPVLLAFVGAIVPSQLGIQEGSQALVARAIGLEPTTAVAVVLLQRIRQLVTAAFAWVLIATARSSRGGRGGGGPGPRYDTGSSPDAEGGISRSPRRGQSNSGATSPISTPIQIANRVPATSAITPAMIAAIGSIPDVTTWIAAFARPSVSRGSTVWRSVTAWITNATEKPSERSWCAIRNPTISAYEPAAAELPASGMNSAHASESTDVTISVRPSPRRRTSAREISAPASAPTPPMPMMTPNVPSDSRSSRRQNSVYSARKNPPENAHTMWESTIGRTSGWWNTSRKPIRRSSPIRGGAPDDDDDDGADDGADDDADDDGAGSAARIRPSNTADHRYVAALITIASGAPKKRIRKPAAAGPVISAIASVDSSFALPSASWRRPISDGRYVLSVIWNSALAAPTTAPVTSTWPIESAPSAHAIVSDAIAAARIRSAAIRIRRLRLRSIHPPPNSPTSSPGAIWIAIRTLTTTSG